MYQFGWDGKTSKPTKEDFTVTAQTLWDDIAHGVLSGVTLRVFAHLALGAKFSNRLEITQVAVAQAMGISPQQVSVAFRQLKEKGYIIRITDPGGLKFWYLDARRTFRGSAERHAREQERQSKQRTKDRVSKVHQLQA
jgi:DNA-binding MarR family transcriptional regulator